MKMLTSWLGKSRRTVFWNGVVQELLKKVVRVCQLVVAVKPPVVHKSDPALNCNVPDCTLISNCMPIYRVRSQLNEAWNKIPEKVFMGLIRIHGGVWQFILSDTV